MSLIIACGEANPTPGSTDDLGSTSTSVGDDTTASTGGGGATMDGDTTAGPTGPNTATDTGTTGDTDPTGDTDDTGPSPCDDNGDCNGAQPFCSPTGTCVDCSNAPDPNAACETFEEGDNPICDQDNGECVACTEDAHCPAQTPVCDNNTCRACNAHADCPDSACKIPLEAGPAVPNEGECFSTEDGAVVDIETSALVTAIAAVGPGEERVIVLTDEMSFAVPETLQIAGNVQIAIIRDDDALFPQLVQSSMDGGSTLNINTNARVWIDGLTFTLNGDGNAPAVVVNDAALHIQRSRIVANFGGGLRLESNAQARVENCFVGGDVNDIDAVAVDASTLRLSYSTVAAGFGDSAALSCSGVGPDLEVDDSILVRRGGAMGDELQCAGAVVTTSVGEANLEITWFSDWAAQDFSLSGAAPNAWLTAAEWNTGDPTADIVGTLRPTVDGTADVAGAHIP